MYGSPKSTSSPSSYSGNILHINNFLSLDAEITYVFLSSPSYATPVTIDVTIPLWPTNLPTAFCSTVKFLSDIDGFIKFI